MMSSNKGGAIERSQDKAAKDTNKRRGGREITNARVVRYDQRCDVSNPYF